MATPSNNPFAAVVVGIPLSNGTFATSPGQGHKSVWRVVLNVGRSQGVVVGQKFVIFALGQELFDPMTGASLGQFEIVRGEGQVRHLQEKMCTVESTNTTQEQRSANNTLAALAGAQSEWITVPAPFGYVSIGDLARRI